MVAIPPYKRRTPPLADSYPVTLCMTLIFVLASLTKSWAVGFDLVTPQHKVSIVYDRSNGKLDSITANLLADDIERVSTYRPLVVGDLTSAKGHVIVIGSIDSQVISRLNPSSIRTRLRGKWECYALTVLNRPLTNIDQALVIAGSDSRGTAYGVFALSERIGVSPWYWWADVKPAPKKNLSVDVNEVVSNEPSVKFRGIFINDEDWGLQPWAAKTFEPQTADIGPKTYAKVFELLLRLKANLIWPAMHPSTKPFYTIAGNKDVAEAYQILVGTSHAEPMLRNNVREWDKKTMGDFNYLTNKNAVYQYWESRVKQAGAGNVIYTIGMRGVHDSGMEGVKDPKEAVPLLERIIADQRGLFQQLINPDVTKVPQALTLYKEVLDVYANGLKVPDDVTLIWPDDNYGYIHQLSNAQETKRSGGSGVYYHASYWGRPHDYLWLSTTHPGLMREEMTKAYAMNANRVWVLNVGDIKPGEYDLQLFMDMAYQIEPFMDSHYSRQHLQNWVSSQFSPALAPGIANSLWTYYQLAFERKPEYMGWSQTEPTTPVKPLTAYNHDSFGDQAQHRLDQYSALEKQVRAIGSTIPSDRKEAYYELVEYPVVGASLMNKKFLYRDKAHLYAEQGRLSASYYAARSQQAYEAIVKETAYFNDQLAGGKWKGIMSMKPRELPVYEMPATDFPHKPVQQTWQIMPEGYSKPKLDTAAVWTLPEFNRWNKQRYFIDIYLCQKTGLAFQVVPSAPWITISQTKGILSPKDGQTDNRVWVEIDWTKAPERQLSGSVAVISGKRTIRVGVKANNEPVSGLRDYTGFIESAGYIAINAASPSTSTNAGATGWKVVEGIGTAGKTLESLPLSAQSTASLVDTATFRKNPSVTYDFYTFRSVPASVTIYTLPTFPLTNEQEMRYAVSLDGGPLTIHNFKTVGRTEEWKQNVLSNAASRTIQQASLSPGKHTLTIYRIDPGVILDRIFIDLGNNRPYYGSLPETVHKASN